MKTKVEPAAENEVELSVEIPADAVKKVYERTVSAFRHELQIPGFRKGHVPRGMVVAHVGEQVIREQTLEDAIPAWGDAALRDAGLHENVVGTSDLKADPLDENADYRFSIKVQLMPTPTLGEYKGLEVPKRKVEVSEEQVDAQMAQLQERLATLQPVEDRPVQSGDFVLMDVDGSHDGKPIPDAQGKNQMFEVGNAQLIPGFEEEIVGVAPGEEKTFELTFPDDYQAQDLAGEKATFTVEIKEIKAKVAPEFDDAFATDISEFETLAELRADLRKRMEAAAADTSDSDFRTAAVDRAVDNATVRVPQVLIDREAHRLYHDLEKSIGERGITMEAYLSVLEKTEQEAEEGMRPQAERILKRRLVLDAIAAAEHLSATDDDIAAAVKHDAEAMGGDYLQLLSDIRKSGRQEQLRAELLVVKTVDYLAENAVEVEMTDADEAAAEEVEADEAAAEAVEDAVEAVEDAADEAADADEAPLA